MKICDSDSLYTWLPTVSAKYVSAIHCKLRFPTISCSNLILAPCPFNGYFILWHAKRTIMLFHTTSCDYSHAPHFLKYPQKIFHLPRTCCISFTTMFANPKTLLLIVSSALVAQAQSSGSSTTSTAPASQTSAAAGLDTCIITCLTAASSTGSCSS